MWGFGCPGGAGPAESGQLCRADRQFGAAPSSAVGDGDEAHRRGVQEAAVAVDAGRRLQAAAGEWEEYMVRFTAAADKSEILSASAFAAGLVGAMEASASQSMRQMWTVIARDGP